MAWKIVKKITRVTRQCGRPENLIWYHVYDGDWQRFTTKDPGLAVKFVEKHGGNAEDIIREA